MNKLTTKLNLFIISIYMTFSKLTAFAEEEIDAIDAIEIDDASIPEIEVIPELPEDAVHEVTEAVTASQPQSLLHDKVTILCAVLIGVILLIILLVILMLKGKKNVKNTTTNSNKEKDNSLRKTNKIKSAMDVEGAVKSFLIRTETMR